MRKPNQKWRILGSAIAVLCFFVVSMAGPRDPRTGPAVQPANTQLPIEASTPSFTSPPPPNHHPIVLAGDAAVSQFFGSTSVNGSGSASSPFVLRDKSITLNDMDVTGINITHSDKYILIENTSIYNGTVDGIYLANDSHVTILDASLSQLGQGIEMYKCTDMAVNDSVIQSMDGNGINILDGSSQVTVANIAISNTGNDAVDVENSSGVALNDISFYEIDGYGMYIEYCTNTIASNCTLVALGDSAFYIESSNTTTLNRISCERIGDEGVYIDSCDKTVVINCTFDGTAEDGMEIDCSNATTLTGIIFNNIGYDGIDVEDSIGVMMTDVSIINIDGDGIYLDDSNNSAMTGITITNAEEDAGIELEDSNNVTMTGITIMNIDDEGIDLDYSNNTTMTGITISNADNEGIYADHSNVVAMTGFTITSTEDQGIDLVTTTNVTMSKITISNADDDGIYLDSSHNMTMTNINITATVGDGIDMESTNNVTMTGITITSSYYEIWEDEIYGGGDGIALESANNVTMTRITITSAEDEGIYADKSNTVTMGRISISNTVEEGIDVEDSNVLSMTGISITNVDEDGGVEVENVNNVKMSGITIANVEGEGIDLDYLKNVSMTGINITNVADNNGIDVSYVNNLTMSGITLTNIQDDGIVIADDDSYNVTMSSITITNAGYYGICMDDTHNATMTGITITDALNDGMYIEGSTIVTMTGITITHVDDDGIYIGGSTNVKMSDITLAYVDDDGLDIEYSTGVALNGISIYDCMWEGTILYELTNVSIHNASITDVYNYNFEFNYCTNVTVTNATTNDGACGFEIVDTTSNFSIATCNFQGVDTGIYCEEWDNVSVKDCNFYGTNVGIEAIAESDSQNFTVDGCYFLNNYQAILLQGSDTVTITDVKILHSIFEKCDYGIEASYVNFTTINANIIAQCIYGAMSFTSCDNFTITNNFVSTTMAAGNGYLVVWSGYDWLLVYNNSFYGASHYLFDYSPIGGITTYTKFDNGAGTGNYWSDYHALYPTAADPVEIWHIPYSLGHGVNDSYPLVHDPNYKAPSIEGTSVITIGIQKNVTLTWQVFGFTSLNNSYVIYENGVPVQSGSWDGNSSVLLDIPSTVAGIYNYTFWISDGITTTQFTSILRVTLLPPALPGYPAGIIAAVLSLGVIAIVVVRRKKFTT